MESWPGVGHWLRCCSLCPQAGCLFRWVLMSLGAGKFSSWCESLEIVAASSPELGFWPQTNSAIYDWILFWWCLPGPAIHELEVLPVFTNIFWGFGLLIKKQVSLINEVYKFHNLLPFIRWYFVCLPLFVSIVAASSRSSSDPLVFKELQIEGNFRCSFPLEQRVESVGKQLYGLGL